MGQRHSQAGEERASGHAYGLEDMIAVRKGYKERRGERGGGRTDTSGKSLVGATNRPNSLSSRLLALRSAQGFTRAYRQTVYALPEPPCSLA